jgi:hypothetical protein
MLPNDDMTKAYIADMLILDSEEEEEHGDDEREEDA